MLASEILQTRVAFLPYGPKSLKTLKPRPWILLPRTLGGHLKKQRMEFGLLQRDVQGRFKLDKETYANWEKDRCYPAMKHWPGIIEFLGRDPTPRPCTIGELLLSYRRRHGLSRRALAALLEVDDVTLWRWETDQRKPQSERHIDAIRRLRDLIAIPHLDQSPSLLSIESGPQRTTRGVSNGPEAEIR